jgi:hypothetical protein
MSLPSTIAGINQLPLDQKRETYSQIIPPKLLEIFDVSSDLRDFDGSDLFFLNCEPGTSDVELALFNSPEASDPIIFGHLTDTIHGQIHILLYGMNDVNSPRFNVDRMPDGTKTSFGTNQRNLDEELKALEAGLAPGQIYRGPHLFKESLRQFEHFASCMGHDIFFVEPLFYHVAVIFERYHFQYQQGKRFVKRINEGFSDGGELVPLLDGSTPFRDPQAANQVRLRSWAIHDNILGEPFDHVTMYKTIDPEEAPCREITLPW